MTTKVLRLRPVLDTVGLSRSSIYAMVAAGKFPKPIRLGPRAVGWLASDVEEWLDTRIQASRAGTSGAQQ